jgi:DNA topoisomerase-2
MLFPEADDAVLHYLNDDGTLVEPEYYVPILPFVLLNGISGIGTGFSSSIPSYNPAQIVRYLQQRLLGESTSGMDFVPYYEGFKGTIAKVADQKFLIKGVYQKTSEDSIRITELPVGSWTMPYITFLEGLMDGAVDAKTGKKSAPVIKDFTSTCTEIAVDISVTFPTGVLAELNKTATPTTINGLEKLLKLTTTVSTTNMHLFNAECKLHKYESVEQILDGFFDVRMAFYGKRKAFLLAELAAKLVRLSNRAKYILANLDGSVDLRKKTAVQVEELLVRGGFVKIDGDYKYLTKMPMDSVTEENVAKILAEKTETETECERLRATTLETMWSGELAAFSQKYEAYKQMREAIQRGATTNGVIKVKKSTKVTKK